VHQKFGLFCWGRWWVIDLGRKEGVLRDDIDVGVVPSVVCTVEKAQSCVFS
jgi:hypothetical protein